MSARKAWFTWQGKRYEAEQPEGGKWLIACPMCGDGIVFSKDGSPHDEMWLPHTVTVAENGALSVMPSVICPRCNQWHVVITDGAA